MVGFDYGEKYLFGVNWKIILSGNDFSVKTNEVNGGIPIFVYQNEKYGMIAFAYIEYPEKININETYYQKILNEIHSKTNDGKPILIYENEKYISFYSEWNEKNNTIYKLEDFKNMFKE
jgi:hypothetical protein